MLGIHSWPEPEHIDISERLTEGGNYLINVQFTINDKKYKCEKITRKHNPLSDLDRQKVILESYIKCLTELLSYVNYYRGLDNDRSGD